MFCIVVIAITPTPASESTRTDRTVRSLKTIDNFDIKKIPKKYTNAQNDLRRRRHDGRQGRIQLDSAGWWLSAIIAKNG
jgi:hypothetical protein